MQREAILVFERRKNTPKQSDRVPSHHCCDFSASS